MTLRGERSDAGDRWTVLVHGEGRDLDAWRPLAMWLGERGFSALAFDLPGHGASDDPWDPALAVPAVLAAIDFARSQGAQRVHLVGEGAGAIAALAAAAGPAQPVASIAGLSPVQDKRGAQPGDVRESPATKRILVVPTLHEFLERAE